MAASALGTACWAAGSAPAAAVSNRHEWPRGRATPALALPMLDGTAWQLAGERGHPVLLNFFASWCEPCRSEMPALQALAARHAAQGLVVLAVDFRESVDTIRRFVQDTGLRLPVLRDADGAAARAFGVRIFPGTVAVARSGRAAFSVVGEADWAAEPAHGWVAALLR